MDYGLLHNNTFFIEGGETAGKVLVGKQYFRWSLAITKVKVNAREPAVLDGEKVVLSNGVSEIVITFSAGEKSKVWEAASSANYLVLPLNDGISSLLFYLQDTKGLAGIDIEYVYYLTELGTYSEEIVLSNYSYSTFSFEGSPTEDQVLTERSYSEFAAPITINFFELIVTEDVTDTCLFRVENEDGDSVLISLPAGSRKTVVKTPLKGTIFKWIFEGGATPVNPRLHFGYTSGDAISETSSVIKSSTYNPKWINHFYEGASLQVEQLTFPEDILIKSFGISVREEMTGNVYLRNGTTGNVVSLSLVGEKYKFTTKGFKLYAGQPLEIDIPETATSYNAYIEFVSLQEEATPSVGGVNVYCDGETESCECAKFLIIRGEAPMTETDKKIIVTFRQREDGTGYVVNIERVDDLDV